LGQLRPAPDPLPQHGGWNPSPYAALAAIAETLTVALVGAAVITNRTPVRTSRR
jgi:hypothetical protein